MENTQWTLTIYGAITAVLVLLLDSVSGVKYEFIAGNLSCHECTYSTQGSNCLTMRDRSLISIQRCTIDETFCMVEKYKTAGNLTTFERRCAVQCEDGCDHAGRWSYRIEKCYNCCNTTYCNSMPHSQTSQVAAVKASTLIPSLCAILLCLVLQ